MLSPSFEILSPLKPIRATIALDKDWRFHRGDVVGAACEGFDDTGWRNLDLPHDWAFEEGISETGAQSEEGGYYPGGIGWYRKIFDVDAVGSDEQWLIEFDGVYMNAEVWLNGESLGLNSYGYATFRLSLEPHLKPCKNVLAVRCDNSLEPSARWYHPCGIYAPVRLIRRSRSHIDNVFVQTIATKDDHADLQVHTARQGDPAVQIQHTLLCPAGKVVVVSNAEDLVVPAPKLWGLEHPYLYTLATTMLCRGEAIDRIFTKVGLRTIRWEAETGFWLNDDNIKLRGVCEHWEGGPVGGAWTPALLRWKLEIIKSMGCNAIRTAHNPFPPFFYDLCDEMGFLVMDEVFDGWKRKADHDYGEQAFERCWEPDLRRWIIRDRNHPSVVIWSVGNETEGDAAVELVRVCHELDPTRPVTSGHAGSEHMDVFGVNGASENQSFYTSDERPLDKPFIATEAPHTWQVRGYYRTASWFRDGNANPRQSPFPLPDLTEEEIFTYDWKEPAQKNDPGKQIFNSSYDNAMVRITARKNWELMRDLPWFSGHFRWTGFDYPGEAGYVHGGWPFRAFMGGTHDLAGLPKDLAYFYQSQWTDQPMVHLLPHWTHPKMDPGTLVPVWAYSNAQEVELFFNDSSLGLRSPGTSALEMQCQWMVPWQPGTLTAVARNYGQEVAYASQTTSLASAKLLFESEAWDDGLHILTFTLADRQGVLVPYADNRVYVYLPEGLSLISHENGNPVDTDNGVSLDSRRAFMGQTRTFVKAVGGSLSSPIIVGSILGSRNGVTEATETPTISIDCQAVDLAGNPVAAQQGGSITVHFTTDGSVPDACSPRYTQPFTVTMPTTVKAAVLYDNRRMLMMEETFASDTGLHWIQPDERDILAGTGSLQADRAKLRGRARVLDDGEGFHGQGYVQLPGNGDSISWYKENDGPAGVFKLKIRYAAEAVDSERTAELIVNDAVVQTLTFVSTGSRNSAWGELETEIHLGRGANTITILAGPYGAASIDQIEVE